MELVASRGNKTAKDLWDALARHMLGSDYGEQDRKTAVLYEYETFKATEGELLLDTYIRYLQVINDLKKCGYSKDNYVNDAMGSKKKNVVVTSDPLALIAGKTNVSRSKEKIVVSSDSEGSEANDFSELKKITALLETSPAIVEPLRIELPFLEDQFQEDPLEDLPEVPMADNRTMAELLQAPTEGYEDAIIIPEIDSLNSAAGENFLDNMPRECLKIIESKSKVRQLRAKAVVPKALLLDKKNQSSAPVQSLTPAPVKAVEPNCVTCGCAHSYQNCLATSRNVYRDNIQEVEKQGTEVTTDQVQTSSSQSTAPVQPPVIQSETQTLVSEPVVAP
nr:hypothetical protein [Tanacetum cinerariifolium]